MNGGRIELKIPKKQASVLWAYFDRLRRVA